MTKFFILITVFLLCACKASNFHSKWTKEQSPATFTARFITSRGNFDIEVTRQLSPLAADRMFQLLHHHVFDSVLFYRVVPRFVAQFGSLDTTVTNKWETYKVTDEPVLKSNARGTISFARSGKDSRGTQLYINLKNNPRLDTVNYEGATGFPVFGVVTTGMDVVDSLFSGYGDTVFDKFDSLSSNRKLFLKEFPKLDSIHSTLILKAKR